MPLRPSVLRLNEAIDSLNNSSECLSPVSTPLTSTCSHSIGTLSALKIVFTDSATSAPIPSPIHASIASVTWSTVLYISGRAQAQLSKENSYIKYVPGINVTVYLPPYLVGLKISDWMVAMAAIRGQRYVIRRTGVVTGDAAYTWQQ